MPTTSRRTNVRSPLKEWSNAQSSGRVTVVTTVKEALLMRTTARMHEDTCVTIRTAIGSEDALHHDVHHCCTRHPFVEKSHICQMKAWPYRQECRGHDPTKKNLLCC